MFEHAPVPTQVTLHAPLPQSIDPLHALLVVHMIAHDFALEQSMLPHT
jgi:hypothetical protein